MHESDLHSCIVDGDADQDEHTGVNLTVMHIDGHPGERPKHPFPPSRVYTRLLAFHLILFTQPFWCGHERWRATVGPLCEFLATDCNFVLGAWRWGQQQSER